MKISIVTAVYNNKENIEDAIKSVLAQTYSDIELIIVDGASNDGTLEIVNRYQQHIDKLITEKDNGIYDALNKGVLASTGNFVGFLHSDDVFASNDVIEKIVSELELNKLDGVYSDLEYVKKDNINSVVRFWKSKSFETKLLKNGWMPPHPTLYIKKSIYSKIGLYDCHFNIAADYDFVLRLFSNTSYKLGYLPITTVKMRVGGESNKKLSNIIKKSKEDYTVMRNHGLNAVWTLMSKNLSKVLQFVERK